MSKSIVWLLLAIAVAGVGSALYLYIERNEAPLATPAPTAVQPAQAAPPAIKPAPDHGNFQKRFQPSMPGK